MPAFRGDHGRGHRLSGCLASDALMLPGSKASPAEPSASSSGPAWDVLRPPEPARKWKEPPGPVKVGNPEGSCRRLFHQCWADPQAKKRASIHIYKYIVEPTKNTRG